MELLDFAADSLVPAASHGSFMSKTADLRIVADGLGMLVPMLDRLAPWIDDSRFSLIISRTGFDLVLECFAFRRGQQYDLARVDLEEPFFLYC